MSLWSTSSTRRRRPVDSGVADPNMGVSENKGYLIGVLIIRMLLCGDTMLGSPIFGNPHTGPQNMGGLHPGWGFRV